MCQKFLPFPFKYWILTLGRCLQKCQLSWFSQVLEFCCFLEFMLSDVVQYDLNIFGGLYPASFHGWKNVCSTFRYVASNSSAVSHFLAFPVRFLYFLVYSAFVSSGGGVLSSWLWKRFSFTKRVFCSGNYHFNWDVTTSIMRSVIYSSFS